MRIGGRVAVIIVGPARGHLLVLAAIGLHLADGDAAGGDVDDDRPVGIRRRAAEDDRVRADQPVRAAVGRHAGIGVAYHDADHVVLRHTVAVIAAAADVRAVASHARCHAEFARTLEHRVIDAVYGHDAGAPAAVIGEGGVRILHAAKVRLGHKGAGHILAQINAQAGESVGIGSGEIRVGDDGGERGGVFFRNALRHDKPLDEGDLLFV